MCVTALFQSQIGEQQIQQLVVQTQGVCHGIELLSKARDRGLFVSCKYWNSLAGLPDVEIDVVEPVREPLGHPAAAHTRGRGRQGRSHAGIAATIDCRRRRLPEPPEPWSGSGT